MKEMMKSRTKAQTTLSFVMTIGIIFIVGVIIIVMKKFLFFQASVLEKDTAQDLMNQIDIAIKKGMSYPSDAKYIIEVPYTEKYTLEINNSRMILSFPQRDITLKRDLLPQNYIILDSKISDSGKIYIRKQEDKILIIDKDVNNITQYLTELESIGKPVEVS